MSALSILLAILKAIPILKNWFDDLVGLYVQAEIERFNAAVKAGIKRAVDEQDQRDLEKTIGSHQAGKPSGASGTEIVDTLPGVQ